MSKTRSFKRHLNPAKVWLANQVAEEKIKIARQVVLERAKKDAAFAADVLKAVGDALPKEIKEACEESVKQKDIKDRLMEETKGLVAKWDKTGLLDGIKNDIDKSEMSVLIESEPKQIIVDYPRDGDEPPLDITEKLVQEEGPKAEKA
jgi:23S rRNA maturation-related 3'-5' exoribonuclease YhaM